MKNAILVTLVATLVVVKSASGASLFTDNFNSYANGNLVGQGPWAQTSTVTATPVQASNGKVAVGTSGQDIYAPLTGGAYTIPDGSSFFIGLTLNLSAAQTTGDYFLHVTPTVGNTSIFTTRLFAKSSGAGFVLGYLENSGTGGAVNYGSTVLSFNTDYRTVIAYNAVAGALNDTASVYVNPSDLAVEGNNTAYISLDAWTTVSAESSTVAGINIRQGAAGSAPTLTVDDLAAGTLFGDVTVMPVPEPSTLALTGLGLASLLVLRRRKN
jgi:hypothetical protein